MKRKHAFTLIELLIVVAIIAILATDTDFYELLAQSGGNTLLAAVTCGLHLLMRRYLTAQNRNWFSETGAYGHRKIYEAVANHDAQGSRAAMIEHIQIARETQTKQVPGVPPEKEVKEVMLGI